jgi:DNA-binding transcriptional MerR regulator
MPYFTHIIPFYLHNLLELLNKMPLDIQIRVCYDYITMRKPDETTQPKEILMREAESIFKGLNDAPPKCNREGILCSTELGKEPEPQESAKELKERIAELQEKKAELSSSLTEVNNKLSELHLKLIRKQMARVERVYSKKTMTKMERVAKELGVSVAALKAAMEEVQ